MTVRMRLRRADGRVYMDRWGFEWPRTNGRHPLFGCFLHRFTAPDPGQDMHDHPWSFLTVPLVGGYEEERSDVRVASGCYGIVERVRRLRPRLMRLDECHRIIQLDRPVVWTLVIHGPWRRLWGFYTPNGWIESSVYDKSVRAERRDLWNEVAS